MACAPKDRGNVPSLDLVRPWCSYLYKNCDSCVLAAVSIVSIECLLVGRLHFHIVTQETFWSAI